MRSLRTAQKPWKFELSEPSFFTILEPSRFRTFHTFPEDIADRRPAPDLDEDPGYADVHFKILAPKLLATLSPADERIVRLFFGFNCQPHSFSEIAEEMTIKETNVRRRYNKALTRIRFQAFRMRLLETPPAQPRRGPKETGATTTSTPPVNVDMEKAPTCPSEWGRCKETIDLFAGQNFEEFALREERSRARNMIADWWAPLPPKPPTSEIAPAAPARPQIEMDDTKPATIPPPPSLLSLIRKSITGWHQGKS